MAGIRDILDWVTGNSDPVQKAKDTLKDNGYEFTATDYVSAAKLGEADTIKLFHDAGMEIDLKDSAGRTALIAAAENGHEDLTQFLIDTGADINATTETGRTALIAASSRGYDASVKTLIDNDADITAKDHDGWTSLSVSAYNSHDEIVSLLAPKASQEALDDAILVASFSGEPETIQELINNGADIHARSPEEKTPLMISAGNGKDAAVQVLLDSKSNPHLVDGKGQTAADIAKKSGYEQTQTALLNQANDNPASSYEKGGDNYAEPKNRGNSKNPDLSDIPLGAIKSSLDNNIAAVTPSQLNNSTEVEASIDKSSNGIG